MEKFIGVKLINAKPMTRLEYNEFRNWTLPEDEDGNDEGYLVEYLDGGKPNHPDYENYVSWSLADVFRNAYHKCDDMTFGLAIEALKMGKRVARKGWNGKNMFLFIVNDRLVERYDCPGLPYISMKTADNKNVPWLASQIDVLSEDWVII
jgi:hypothetical protein